MKFYFERQFITTGSPIKSLGDDTTSSTDPFKKGSASVELMAAMPLIAIFVIVIVQFSALFTDAVHNVAAAYATASSTVNRWNELHQTRGFSRPCMGPDELAAEGLPHTITAEGNSISLGVGNYKKNVIIPQEVKIVTQKICTPW